MLPEARRYRVITAADRDNIPKLIVRAKKVRTGLGAFPSVYVDLPVSLTEFDDQLKEAEAKQFQVASRIPGARAKRDVACDELYTSLELYRAFVQSLVSASPEKAFALAEDAGMKIAVTPTVSKPVLEVYLVKSGAVGLRAYAKLLSKGKKSRCFNWQYSLDGGKTWVSAASTPVARTTISGLPALTTCSFRVSVTRPDGQSEWSQAVTFLVQ